MIKNKLTVLFLGAALAASATVANAAVRQGMVETSFSGAYSHLKSGGDSMDLWLGDVKAGYFVMEPLEVSVAATYLKADLGGGADLRALMLGAGVDYHFMTRTPLVPYVGAGLHWVDLKSGGAGSDDWAWDVHAGLKQFVSQNVAIKYEVSYLKFDDFDLKGINVSVGLSFFF
jgi:opacity protein-like surface antigen